MTRHHALRAVSITALVLLLAAGFVRATTLLQLTYNELVSASERIFTGVVVDVTVTTEGDLVYSTVHFTVDAVIKGELADTTLERTLELRFLGGTSAGLQTEVVGQFIPAIGAHGLWFVDDAERDLVNPLTGWSQGYFPFVETADGSRWLDLRDHPDYGLLQENPDPLAGKMRDLNFTRAQIAEKYPERLRFPLDDFIVAINAVMAEQGE